MNGNIPVLSACGKSLAEAWENAVLCCWQSGVEIKTEYDKPTDPLSKDCTMMWTCEEPFSEPRIHRGFPDSLEGLEIYRQEVVEGIHDHWINPDEGKWTYTYHKRLFAYDIEWQTINQIQYMIDKLCEAYHTRRAQAITWNVKTDPPTNDPPCLQRIWCRILANNQGQLVLNMNTHWRSRDAYKAAFMNAFALTDLQRKIAEQISEKIGQPVAVGRYTDISDSFHVYGAYFSEFQQRFLNSINNRSFVERTWTMEFAEPVFEEVREKLNQNPDFQLCK